MAPTGKPQEAPLKCPRCDSPNTKFCYYNNYSLTQPRHFCKTCRRYWTKGGALRTVPIGGASRKNKNISSSPKALKFFQGISPAIDFNHLHFAPAPAPYNFDFSVSQEMGFRSSVVSSIESLSSINQDLHWRMQKHRLSTLLPGDDRKNCSSGDRKPPQQVMFEYLECSGMKSPGKDGDGIVGREWYFDNCYATPATSNENGSGWSSGVQACCDLPHYSSIP